MSKHILTADGHLYHCDPAGDELYHYGVPGMKWGRRKAKDPTGMRGIRRSYSNQSKAARAAYKNQQAAIKNERKAAINAQKQTPEYKAKRKKALIVGTAVVGTALAAYGTYKVSKMVKDKRAAVERAQKLLAAQSYQSDVRRAMQNASNVASSQYGVKYASRVVTDAAGNVIDRIGR